jgi:hypothetical protein
MRSPFSRHHASATVNAASGCCHFSGGKTATRSRVMGRYPLASSLSVGQASAKPICHVGKQLRHRGLADEVIAISFC